MIETFRSPKPGNENDCAALSAEPNGNLAGVLLKVVEDTPKVYNLLVCTLCRWAPYFEYAVVSLSQLVLSTVTVSGR